MSKKVKIPVFIAVVAVIVVLGVLLVKVAYKGLLYAVYPIKYETVVTNASGNYSVAPELIYAVIKAESNFSPDAVSSAGAVGLMQLMPNTFSWLQEKRGITEKNGSDALFNFSVNIDYGTYYLSILLGKYDAKSSAVASYNAGTDTVDKWLTNEQFSGDGKTLINIPYKQTDEYVDKVLSYEKVYKELYFDIE